MCGRLAGLRSRAGAAIRIRGIFQGQALGTRIASTANKSCLFSNRIEHQLGRPALDEPQDLGANESRDVPGFKAVLVRLPGLPGPLDGLGFVKDDGDGDVVEVADGNDEVATRS